MMIDDRPSRDSILIDQAALYALRSTCSRAHVGCVIATVDYRPLVSGYNGAPAKQPHCEHICTCGRDVRWRAERTLAIINNRMLVFAEQHADNCLGQKPCTIAVHAEANAIAYAARAGVRVESCQLATTLAPCLNCSMLIINAGISRVIFKERHRDMSGVDLLDNAGVEVIKWST